MKDVFEFEVIDGIIIIANKNDYDEVHITVDEMEGALNNAYQQGKAELYAKIKVLVEKRETENCKYDSCDDCAKCCEISALDWLLEQLKGAEE